MADIITKIQDVRIGDIFLGPIGGLVGTAIGAGELLLDGGFHIGDVDVRHAGIVVKAEPGTNYDDPAYPNGIMDSFELAQAMPKGAEIATMTYAKHWTKQCLYVRLPEDYPGQAADAAFIAKAMVLAGVPYSYLSYLALAAHKQTGGWPKLDAWISRTREPMDLRLPSGRPTEPLALPVEAICSVFVDQAWTLAGKTVMEGVARQAVSPSSLATALLWTDGAEFGWPGRHPFTPAL